jgi:hypothetical protein
MDIDPVETSAFPWSDFRTVLFDANGDSTSDNAVQRVVFAGGEAGGETTLETPLPDFAVSGPLYVAPGYRSYEKMDHVSIFEQRSEGLLDMGLSVPEPATRVLLALAAVICLKRRRLGTQVPRSTTDETKTRPGRASIDGTERSARV